MCQSVRPHKRRETYDLRTIAVSIAVGAIVQERVIDVALLKIVGLQLWQNSRSWAGKVSE